MDTRSPATAPRARRGSGSDCGVYIVGPLLGAPLGAITYEYVRAEHQQYRFTTTTPRKRSPMATALFVCLHNAGRSQMSAALFERAAHGRHHALSAGSEANPDGRVHPQVVEVMRELGIDLSDRQPQRLTRELAEQADVVVAMGAATPAPSSPASATSTGSSPTPKASPSTKSAPSATTSTGASASWSASSTQPPKQHEKRSTAGSRYPALTCATSSAPRPGAANARGAFSPATVAGCQRSKVAPLCR